MQLYQGINRYICLQANKCEVSIFIMNVEQYLLRSRRKRDSLKHVYIVYFHVQKDWKGEKRNAIDSCFSVSETKDSTVGLTYGNILYYM